MITVYIKYQLTAFFNCRMGDNVNNDKGVDDV